MISGFDYGTSNCAIGIIDPATAKTQLLALEGQQSLLPSTLYALGRELICEQVASGIQNVDMRRDYLKSRSTRLSTAKRVRREERISDEEQSLYFGRAAFEEYFSLPEEGYFVKSVKSFLGTSGVRAEYIHLFEDIVTAMMMQIKQRAEHACQAELTHTVIGRPVNFQGLNAEQSNSQALAILEISAMRAGFKSVQFLYEPIAAGLDFERRLDSDKKVLVVDIGGGTSDCAMVCMGPSHIGNIDREADFIGHCGERIGGNDFDIQIAAKTLMPLLGMRSFLKNGLPMPTQVYWNAVSTNDVGAQAEFSKLETSLLLDRLLIETKEPKLFERFMKIHRDKQNNQIVATAEQAKIQLSEVSEVDLSLDYIEAALSSHITIEEMQVAVRAPLKKMIDIIKETITQAGVQPDLIFITGGSAKSPVIRQAISREIADIEIVEGDHFGSVANGLTLWAQRIFR